MPQSLKTIFLTAVLCHLSLIFFAQKTNWQQQVNFLIDVTLNDKEHTLDGFEKMEYINNSPDTLTFIWIHLWPNAYKNDKTAFSDQLLENGDTKFYFADKEQRGYINRLDFKVDNVTAKTEDHPQYADIIKLWLPAPLLPNQKAVITTPFHEKLPYNFSRGGHVGKQYQVTQWYPKPAVYDQEGWHPMPYLDQGEFYNDFGNYEVRISVPKDYVVAATGNLQDEAEKQWMLSRIPPTETKVKKPATRTNHTPAKKTNTVKKRVSKPTVNAETAEYKTLRYTQDNVTDFAWFADKHFMVAHDTISIAGKSIDAYAFYLQKNAGMWKNGLAVIKQTIQTRSQWIGNYPYQTVAVVDGVQEFNGGMEYPTIAIVSGMEDENDLASLIEHEVGHNWFCAILQNNERDHPWMDEGFNSYYDNRFFNVGAGGSGNDTANKSVVLNNRLERILFESMAHEKLDQPVNTPSAKFSAVNYGLSSYYKAAVFFSLLEKKLGTSIFDKGMQHYYNQYRFRHVNPSAFKNVMEKTSGLNLDSIFNYLDGTGILPSMQREGWKVTSIFNRKTIQQYINFPSKNLLLISPALGYNMYDKFMIGAIATNYKLPPSAFQFLAVPLYATGTKRFGGIGKLNYSFFPQGIFRKTDLFVNASSFSMNEYQDEKGEKTSLSFFKIVPGFKLTAREKNARSTLNKFIQWKTYLIGEDQFHFYADTVINGIDTSVVTAVDKERQNKTINQLRLVIENTRALYPYTGELKAEQGKDFVRTSFTGNYFFNYAKEGGLSVRLFAGKFFYTGGKTSSKQFSTDRYHLNMTGANGYEDYTYSDYFIGRNEFEGLASQQIMMRDGAFKVRTDLLSQKTGKTDDWLVAANFTTTIPSKINPLSVLPVKIPLRLFADVGTYAGAWKKNAEADHFLFDAGLHIPLLKEVVNIYIPLIYSSVYKDYLKSTIQKNRLLKTISFSIDLSKMNAIKRSRLLDL